MGVLGSVDESRMALEGSREVGILVYLQAHHTAGSVGEGSFVVSTVVGRILTGLADADIVVAGSVDESRMALERSREMGILVDLQAHHIAGSVVEGGIVVSSDSAAVHVNLRREAPDRFDCPVVEYGSSAAESSLDPWVGGD